MNEYGKIIVVEDDILTSPYFLNYMNDALDMYERDEDVACISAYTYPIKTDKQSFFIKGADCWGWATWKRGWECFEVSGQKLFDELNHKILAMSVILMVHILTHKCLKTKLMVRMILGL